MLPQEFIYLSSSLGISCNISKFVENQQLQNFAQFLTIMTTFKSILDREGCIWCGAKWRTTLSKRSELDTWVRELITWAWKEKEHVVPYFHSSDFIISITTIHIGHAASAVQPLQIDSFMATAARSSRLLAALVSSTLLLLLLFVPPAARGASRDHQLPAAAVLVRVPAAGPSLLCL